jgi:hypothetical protein
MLEQHLAADPFRQWRTVVAQRNCPVRRYPRDRNAATDGGNGFAPDAVEDAGRMQMAWAYLIGLGFVLWAACGAVIAIGRRIWGLDTTLRIHLVVAPIIAFVVSAAHKLLAAEFSSVLRATVITGLVVILDAVVVAPLFERSYAMFRSLIGTWIPFGAIFVASLAAGMLVRA